MKRTGHSPASRNTPDGTASEVVLELGHGERNARNSEGAFIDLSDGRIMFAYTRFPGSRWGDNDRATIAARFSDDGGRTWSRRDRILVAREGGFNVMSPSLIALAPGRIGLMYLRKNHLHDCRLFMRTSEDDGKTWSEAAPCIPAPGYFVVNNDRVVQLSDGRIVVPAAFHRARLAGETKDLAGWDWRGLALFFHSDDGGRSWKESSDWWGLPVPSRSGLQEPGLVEMKDGSLYAWARTDTGCQWHMVSTDRGATWSPPSPSRFHSPCSALSMKRVPATGELLAVWNDHARRWKLPSPARSSWGRTPLVAALSADEGKTWKARLVESDPRRGYCYTAIHFTRGAALLAYSCGGVGSGVLQDLRVRRIALDWLRAPGARARAASR